jgi:hypothetical protein
MLLRVEERHVVQRDRTIAQFLVHNQRKRQIQNDATKKKKKKQKQKQKQKPVVDCEPEKSSNQTEFRRHFLCRQIEPKRSLVLPETKIIKKTNKKMQKLPINKHSIVGIQYFPNCKLEKLLFH